MDLQTPRTPLVSAVTAETAEAEVTEPDFWARELRELRCFVDVVGLLRRDGVETYLELGPGEVLARMLDACPGPVGDGTDRTPAVLTVTRDRRVLPGGRKSFPVPRSPDVG